jgi:glutathione peroxidase
LRRHLQGLEIVCFPCNQFGKQEPGTLAEIKKFAADFGDCGTMMDKVSPLVLTA